jgi:hypothetical protein
MVLSLTFTVSKIVRLIVNNALRLDDLLTVLDRELYKIRLGVFFREYPSKNFDGRPWSTLSEIIMVRHLASSPLYSKLSLISAGC